MKIRNYFIWIIALASIAMASEKWINYSSPFPIKSSISFGDGVLLATDGGVRYRSPQGDDLYTSSDGLETSKFSALAASDRGVYAVSENGVVATMGSHGRWSVISRAYAGSSVRTIPNMVRVMGSTLIIAFDDRLAFFDLNTISSIISIEQIANMSLLKNPVTAMEARGDSLYVAMGGFLYVRKMDWEHLADDFRLSDPLSWELVREEKAIRTILWKDGELKTYPVAGVRTWNGNDIDLSVFDESFEVSVSNVPNLLNGDEINVSSFSEFSKVIVDGKTLKNKILYSYSAVTKKDSLTGRLDTVAYKVENLIKWASKLPSGKTMLVGENRIYYYDGKLNDMTEYAGFRLGNAYELEMMPHGGVLAASVEGNFAFNAGTEWSGNMDAWIDGPIKVGNSTDASAHGLKELSVLADGTVFYHLWGLGLFLYSDWGKERFYSGYPSDEPCLETYHGGVRAVATTRAPDNSGFLTAIASDSVGYGLVYVKPNGEITCASRIGHSKLAGPMTSRFDAETRKWVVYVGTRSSTTKTSDGGLDVIRFDSPNASGGYINVDTVEYYSGYSTTPLDMVYDPKSEYLWIVTSSALEYWEDNSENRQDSLRTPFSMNGLTGAEFTSIDVDARGNLWVGTSAQGIYRLTPRKLNPDTLSVEHFTERNGLLNDAVQDIAVDSVLGAVWVGHANGVSFYRRSDLRSAAGNMTDDAKFEVKVYPNPYRMREHEFVVFDNVAEDAVIAIYNAGGNLVRMLRGDALRGGRAEWDGKDKRGRDVTPGVYHYVVKTSSEVKKGKLIVVR